MVTVLESASFAGAFQIDRHRSYFVGVTRGNAMSGQKRPFVPSIAASFLVMLGVAVSLFGAEDPFAGTWKLNVAKSKYNPGPGPEAAITTVRVMRVEDDTYGVNTRIMEGGKVIETSFVAKTNGTPAPITGSPAADTVYVRRIDNRTLISESTKAGIPVGRSRITVSQDGKVLTSTGSTLNPKGARIDFTAVYERQYTQ
jgi:hypothetical protein